MVEVKVVIKMRLQEDKFSTDEFQEFISQVKSGKMAQDTQEESESGDMFISIRTFCFIKKPPSRNKGE